MQNDRESEIKLSQWLTELHIGWNGNFTDVRELHLSHSRLTSIPESLGKLINLQWFCIDSDKLTTLAPLQSLTQKYLDVEYFDTVLPRRYWTKFSDWQPEWLLDEDNTEIRRTLIQQIGFDLDRSID